jgi:AraC family transcriptional regulator
VGGLVQLDSAASIPVSAASNTVLLVPAATTIVSSGESWKTLRIDHMQSEPSESSDCAVGAHVVAVNSGDPIDLEMSWGGAPWQTYRVPTRAVHVIPADISHRARWHQPCEWIALLLAPSVVNAAGGESGPVELRAAIGVEEPVLAELLFALRDEARQGSLGGRLYAEALAAAIAAQLVRKYAEVRPAHRGGLPANKLRTVVRYIHEHLEMDLALQGLADVARMNVHGFVRSFRQSTGLPPHQYVLRQRIERAKALLRDSPLSIAEVALRTGFANQSNFTTAFRRLTSITPSAWRRMQGPLS